LANKSNYYPRTLRL